MVPLSKVLLSAARPQGQEPPPQCQAAQSPSVPLSASIAAEAELEDPLWVVGPTGHPRSSSNLVFKVYTLHLRYIPWNKVHRNLKTEFQPYTKVEYFVLRFTDPYILGIYLAFRVGNLIIRLTTLFLF